MTSWLPGPGAPLPHFVSTEPFDPQSVAVMTASQERVYRASQLRLMWWKFRRHRLALVSAVFLVTLYAMIAIVEFLAPYNLHTRNVDYIHAPPPPLPYRPLPAPSPFGLGAVCPTRI